MSQPITLTLAQRAPRPLRWLGILLVLMTQHRVIQLFKLVVAQRTG